MQVYCIIGDERVTQAKSPAMFSAVLQRLGMKGAYVPFKVAPEQIGQAMQSLRTLNIAGANVTVPYKEAVVPHMNILSEGATVIGAINTIVIKGDELKGYNTNAIGFMDTLSDVDFEMEGKTALVLGTGGAAMAVTFIFNWLRTANIIVAGRDMAKTRRIVKRFRGEAKQLNTLPEKPIRADIIVNATSVSTAEESSELADLAQHLNISGCELMIDLNYGRTNNFWREMAARNRICFMDGLKTLAFQARRTFFLWTGVQAPAEEFLRGLGADLK